MRGVTVGRGAIKISLPAPAFPPIAGPAGPLTLRIDPIFQERELGVLGDQESIWEGPVTVTGSRRGRGFQELVSYARERRKSD